VNLRSALIWANTRDKGQVTAALSLWQAIQGELLHVLRRAPTFVEVNVAELQKDVGHVGREVVHGAVYTEAHKEARADVEFDSPDAAFEAEQLKDAVEGFVEAEKLAEKTNKLTKQGAEHITEDVINEVLGGSKHEAHLTEIRDTPNWGKAIMES